MIIDRERRAREIRAVCQELRLSSSVADSFINGTSGITADELRRLAGRPTTPAQQQHARNGTATSLFAHRPRDEQMDHVNALAKSWLPQ